MKGLISSESGVATLWAAIAVGVLFIFFVSLVRVSFINTSVNIDLQGAIADACTAACNQVEARSEADGYPLIETGKAHEAFRKMLALNLNLDPVTLTPNIGSPLKREPDYNLIIYNGFDYYNESTMDGGPAEPHTNYILASGSLSINRYAGEGWPKSFDINEDGTRVFEVELPNAGVVAVVDIELNEVVGNKTLSARRWASAILTCDGGVCPEPPGPEPILP